MDLAPHTIVIGAADPVTRSYLRRLVADRPSLRLRGEAETAVTALYMAASMKPQLVVLADESPGIRGRDVVREIVQDSGGALVVLLVDGDPSAAAFDGVTRVLRYDDLDGVGRALDDLIHHVESPAAAGPPERRSRGRDRRVKQDWSKVFAECRSGDRRASS